MAAPSSSASISVDSGGSNKVSSNGSLESEQNRSIIVEGRAETSTCQFTVKGRGVNDL